MILGSGESGFMNFGLAFNSLEFFESDIKLISKSAIHRLRYGSLLYGLNNYNKLDYEIPMIKAFYHKEMEFDEIVDLDLQSKTISLFTRKKFSFDYMIVNTGYELDEDSLLYKNLKNKLDSSNSMVFTDNDESYQKLRDNLEILNDSDTFNVFIQKNSREI